MDCNGLPDILRFLVASDVHAGYGETKKHIHDDSFVNLEEVLRHGVEKNVDFVLLGGDLFHENNPSRETQLKVTRLLRRHCYRNRPSSIEFLSDPKINFHHSNFPTVNYEDENIRVGMPVFTIHGNHDDLSGKGLTALDVFHEAGLVNLFGKFNDVDHIEVSPILLRKGRTKIALYGISSQRDDRLSRAFMNGSVKFLRPDVDVDTWFSILVVHQNRPRRSTSRTTGAFLPIMFIPPFFDLVIWGHEHECLIEPQYFTVGEDVNGDNGFFIIQPGSTVATSLCREEAVPKHCAVISVKEREFKSKPIPLERVRQIILDELHLTDLSTMRKLPRSTIRQKNMPDEELIAQRIEELLQQAESERGLCQPTPPLVRLKIVYSGQWTNIPPINARRFGARYADRVANASEMISIRTIRPDTKPDVKDPLDVVLRKTIDDIHSVDQMVEKYFGECTFDDKMSVLTEVAMSRSMKEYSNVDATFTAADRSLTESIKSQIGAFTSRILTASEMLKLDNVNEDVLTRKVDQIVSELKKQQSGVSMTMQSSYAARGSFTQQSNAAYANDSLTAGVKEEAMDEEDASFAAPPARATQKRAAPLRYGVVKEEPMMEDDAPAATFEAQISSRTADIFQRRSTGAMPPPKARVANPTRQPLATRANDSVVTIDDDF